MRCSRGTSRSPISHYSGHAPTTTKHPCRARTPPAIVDRLNAEFVKALRNPASEKCFVAQTLEVVGNSPAEFAKFLKADHAGRLLKALGVQRQAAPN